MKLNFNTLVKWSAAIFGGAVLAACADLSDLENRVDDLESRVSALEAQIPALNESVLAINALFESYGNDASVIVNLQQVTENNETYYTFQLSGDETGTVYTLKQGQPGSAPEIDVRYNEETGKYEWWANYAGEGEEDDWQQIKVNGTEDPATTDAVVPQFRVSENGYWEVSTDKGQKWTPVYYIGTQDPVPAIGSDSQWFEDISYNPESNILSITMGETVYEILALSDFSCVITDADGEKVEYNFPVVFAAGETRNYTVAMTGVETARVIAPSGWTAELGDPDAAGKANFSITAPGAAAGTSASAAASAPQTKVSANSKTDITIHAINAKGLSIFAKMQVKAVEGTIPEMTVTAASEQGYSSVRFDVTDISNTTSFKYLLYPEDEPAPTESMLISLGTAIDSDSETQLVFKQTSTGASIEYGTGYTLYVLPYNSDIAGSTQTANATTKIPDSYFEVYDSGDDLVIGGKVYNKATYGTAVEITENTEITALTDSEKENIVCFINPEINVTYNAMNGENLLRVANCILIGNDINQKSSITIGRQINMNPTTHNIGESSFLCYNLIADISQVKNQSNATSYALAVNKDGAMKYLGIIDCKIVYGTQPFTYISSNNRCITEFAMHNCINEYIAQNARQNKFVISLSNSTATYGSVTFDNNIFYCSIPERQFKLYTGASSSLGKLIMTNNTFINLDAEANCIINSGHIQNVNISRNLYWNDNLTSSTTGFINCATTWPTGTICSDNISYCNKTVTIFNRTDVPFVSASEITKVESDPFAGGNFDIDNEIFKPNDTYTDYGSSIGR